MITIKHPKNLVINGKYPIFAESRLLSEHSLAAKLVSVSTNQKHVFEPLHPPAMHSNAGTNNKQICNCHLNCA